MWLYKSLKFVFSCWLYNSKVLSLCLKEAGRSVRTAPDFLHTVPWILHKPSERDTVRWPHTFRERAGQRRCTNRGRNFVRSKRRSTYTSSGTLYLFLRLNNSETTFGNAFWAQRWRARTVPWPQIFNSWKSCAPLGLHFCNAFAFPKWSCWGVPAPNPAE